MPRLVPEHFETNLRLSSAAQGLVQVCVRAKMCCVWYPVGPFVDNAPGGAMLLSFFSANAPGGASSAKKTRNRPGTEQTPLGARFQKYCFDRPRGRSLRYLRYFSVVTSKCTRAHALKWREDSRYHLLVYVRFVLPRSRASLVVPAVRVSCNYVGLTEMLPLCPVERIKQGHIHTKRCPTQTNHSMPCF